MDEAKGPMVSIRLTMTSSTRYMNTRDKKKINNREITLFQDKKSGDHALYHIFTRLV